jgi:histidinol-phosphate aminotransferase
MAFRTAWLPSTSDRDPDKMTSKHAVGPITDYVANVNGSLGRVSDKARMIFLAKHKNPTGPLLLRSETRWLQAGVPEGYSFSSVQPMRTMCRTGFDLVAASFNVLVTLTFSSVLGLAGLHVGRAYCPTKAANVLNRLRGLFSRSVPAMSAENVVMQGQEDLEQTVAHNDTWLAWRAIELSILGLKLTPSVEHFLLTHFPNGTCRYVNVTDSYLKEHWFVVRRKDACGLPRALRATVGTEEANRGLLACLKAFLS